MKPSCGCCSGVEQSCGCCSGVEQSCGCCGGVEVVTPQIEANRPGLTALSYRAGTYATFFESMVARLSNLYLDIAPLGGSGAVQRIYPLSKLTTRELTDPSIALLDSWAIVADILTFYQERIANEGYLQTATERLSVLQLAQLAGYKLRPGVAASVYLAFTTALDFKGTIPAGTRAQSIPGTGETPQFFETSTDLTARYGWNNLRPRLTRPQVITLKVDSGTDAATRDTLYFQGIATNLKTGDSLLIVLGNGVGQQVQRFIAAVNPQASQNRTEVTLQEAPPQQDNSPASTAKDALNPFIDQAASIFANSDLAGTVAEILTTLLANIPSAPDNQSAADMVSAAIPQIQEQHDIAARRNFTRLEPWTADLLRAMNELVPLIAELDVDVPASGATQFVPSPLAPSALANLTAILEPLARPRSLQPANSQRLRRSVAQVFSSQADTAPRLLAAFRPAIASTIYRAWAGISTPAPQPEVYAMRVKASPFGSNAPQQFQVPHVGAVPTPQEWPLSSTDESVSLYLDASYDKIVARSWIVVNSPDMTAPIITQAADVGTVSRADYGMAARVTQVNLGQSWLPTSHATPATIDTLRRVTAWAQPELLQLAEEPLDTDVQGNSIELAQLYDGLESGRWLIVSGERTDIPNTTGVIASELVMISAVTQGLNAPLCVPFPANYVPFSRIFYTTDANSRGDRLVVGELSGDAAGVAQLQTVPVPSVPDQQFCQQAQLAQGFYVNAYVPSADERAGKFPDFEGLLMDPATNLPFAQGQIPATQLGFVFGWRISTGAVHTTLTLANSLAYKYDSTSVNLYGNIVKATHGQTIGEVLGNGDASQAFQQFELGQKPLTYVSATTPEGVESTLVVRVNEVRWDEADNLAILGPGDREYVTTADDNDITTVTFGNGTHGARVPTGNSNVKATYRYGIGAGGNVRAMQISQLATHPQGVQGVINPLEASGGADRDDIGAARRNTPLALLALDRLVSVSDYADFSRTFAGVGKATSARLSDGRRQVVHVTIAGAEDIPIKTSDLYQNLVQSLYQFGDPYLPIQVAVRKLKLLVIGARVKLDPAYTWEAVEANARAALLDKFSFDNRELGQSAFMSEAIAVLQAIAGVVYVDVQTFDAVAEDSTASQLASLAGTLSPRNAVEADLARVNPGAADPASRIAPAELVILTPAIPDTLILTEIAS